MTDETEEKCGCGAELNLNSYCPHCDDSFDYHPLCSDCLFEHITMCEGIDDE